MSSERAREQYENYRFCYDNGHQKFIDKARQCFEFWNGEQWDPRVKAVLCREGRPALTFNVIESLVRAMKGVQRALRNDVRYVPTYDADATAAKVRDAIWLDVQNQNALDFVESEVYEKGLIMSRAYYDVRMDYSQSIHGDIRIRSRRSQDVVLDPSVDQYDPDEWPQVWTRRWVSASDIKQRYGKDIHKHLAHIGLPSWYDYEDKFLAQQMGGLPYYHRSHYGDLDEKNVRAHLLLERQYTVFKRKNVFVDVYTGDTSEIPENWDDERIARVLANVDGLTVMPRDVKTVRWVVTCEDIVLHDEDSPYGHFTIVPFFPNFVDGVTMGAVESLIDAQQLYNKITSSELHIISTTANSGYKLKRGSLKNMTVEELEANGARTGFVAELEDVNDLEKITPNSTPQGHDRLSFKADQIMRSLSGVSNQARGFAREDVAGEAILANQAAQDVNFAGWLANLHRSKQILARNVLDLARTHYTEPRVLLINRGTAMVPNMEEVVLNQPTEEGTVLNDVTRGRYSTVLIPAPSRTTMSEEDFSVLLKLRTEVGVAIPDTLLLELSPAVNKAAILQALEGGQDSNERQRAAEEAAAQQQQLQAQLEMARAQKEAAAAMLNQARAEKANIEAASDPDASYERVEMARIAQDAERERGKQAMEQQKLDNQKAYQEQQIALRLTELEDARERAQRDRDAGAQYDRHAAQQKTKPGTEKR